LLSDVPVVGQTNGASIVDAALSVLKALEATASGEATVESAIGRIRPLATKSDGESTVTADMLNFVYPNGTSNGMATVTVTIKVQKSLEAVIAGESVPAAALNVALALLVESSGLSHPYGTLNVEGLGLGPASSRGRARVRGDLTVIHFASSHSLKDDPRIIVRTIP
jgi:hypothetical protein